MKLSYISLRGISLMVTGCLMLTPLALGQNPPVAKPTNNSPALYVPELPRLVKEQPASELRDLVERFSSDRAGLLRRYNVEYSPLRRAELREFTQAWHARLEAMNFEGLSPEAKIDYVLLRNRLGHEAELLAREEKNWKEALPLLPFADTIFDFMEGRRKLETIDSAAAAGTLARLVEEIDKTRKGVEAGLKADPKAEQQPKEAIKTTKVVAFRAAELLNIQRRTLEQWFKYYSGYDPLFTWWNSAPYKKADDALKAYIKVLRERVVGAKEGEDEPIVGDPIGRDALLTDLGFEMIPYTPEELVAIAQKELAWCEAEMRKAAREMGFGDDWKAALEKVKTLHMDPGKQPDLIRDLAWEAIEFVEKRNLITVPPLAKDIWRMEMMTPERQKESPFFLGGETILVSFPTDTMSHEDKLMSMRGNNIHFARATVHHELIPGHHLQGFMTERYMQHRRAFSTPFWTEGWAFYWEIVLWHNSFPRSPQDRVGMLFWRMHRAARIIFSLSFHLGTMTPQQCIDFLVERVGHERANATAEVRRSFNGSYPPLYQIAYMIGGLQLWALRHDLVDSGKMSNRDFHDAILKGNRIPIEMVRAMLTKQPPARDYKANWKFAGEDLLKK